MTPRAAGLRTAGHSTAGRSSAGSRLDLCPIARPIPDVVSVLLLAGCVVSDVICGDVR
jgi:hypothetical protein